jgi:hypothetical protein
MSYKAPQRTMIEDNRRSERAAELARTRLSEVIESGSTNNDGRKWTIHAIFSREHRETTLPRPIPRLTPTSSPSRETSMSGGALVGVVAGVCAVDSVTPFSSDSFSSV